MPELRWTLLIIGVLFVAILAWWERRRPHQASRQAPHISGEPRPVVTNDPSWGPEVESPLPRVMREPTFSLPVVEIPPEQFQAAELAAEPAFEPMAAPVAEPEPEPEAIQLEDYVEEDAEPEVEVTAAAPVAATPATAPAPTSTATPAATELPPPVLNTVRPIVDWPPEDQRKLVSLRLVARPPDRFRGNLVRQALCAEGFVLGDFDIYHKPDAANRAVLSAASLTKPGTFDLDTMDSQRYVGLNLFAVLPGPRTPHKAFEDLLLTARMLNERLEGALQDERGGPLTPTRIQAIRDALGHS